MKFVYQKWNEFPLCSKNLILQLIRNLFINQNTVYQSIHILSPIIGKVEVSCMMAAFVFSGYLSVDVLNLKSNHKITLVKLNIRNPFLVSVFNSNNTQIEKIQFILSFQCVLYKQVDSIQLYYDYLISQQNQLKYFD